MTDYSKVLHLIDYVKQLEDQIARLLALLEEAYPYVEICADDTLPNPAHDVLEQIDKVLVK